MAEPVPLELASVDASTTVVTADGATARALRGAVATQLRAAGIVVHETPDVLPLAAFATRARSALRARAGLTLLPLLSQPAAAELWCQAVTEDAGDRLLAPAVAARSASSAHQLLTEFLVDERDQALLATESSRAFMRWRGTYLARCDDLQRADPAGVFGELVGALAMSSAKAAFAATTRPRLVALGARPWRPAHRALFDALEGAGAAVEYAVWRSSVATPTLRARYAPTPAAEVDAVASWCAEVLAERGESAQVAVVVSDLADRAAGLDDALAERLDLRLDGGSNYSLDHGRPLAQEALVGDALAALRSLSGALSLDDAARVLLSPYFCVPDAEAAQITAQATVHAALLAELEDSGEREFKLARLGSAATRVASKIDAAAGASRWLLALTSQPDLPVPGERRTAREWVERFATALTALGWPLGRALDLGEQRTENAFDDLLDSFATLGDVLLPLDVSGALDALDALAANSPAPSSSVSAPVSVLTPEAAVDRPWTHLWMVGMTESSWPAAVTPNPFLPHSTQQAAGMPGATADATHAATVALTTALFAATEQSVTFSYAELDGDSEQGPSPMLVQWQGMSKQTPVGDAAPNSFERARASAPPLERFADWQAHALPHGARATGGSWTLADQAACPFRAFAARRLSAEKITRRDSALDALLRGNLLHATLQDVWSELHDSTALAQLDDSGLEAIVARHAGTHLARAAAKAPSVLQPALLRLERIRLVSLVMQWLALERQRPPFSLHAAEREQVAEFGGLTWKLRVDRVDRTADGLLVIDYKSGAPHSLAGWLNERPLAPQLPLYGLLLDEPAAGLAFAFLRRGKQGFRGWGQGDEMPLGVVDPREDSSAKKADETHGWPVWRQRWSDRLERLSEEHREGVAVARPESPQVCQQCDKHGLCRIGDVGPAADAEGALAELAVVIDGSDA